MKSAARLCSPAGAGIFVLALLISVEIAHAQNEPILVPDAIYHKGEGDKAPTAAISILDSVANPDYVSATTAAWNDTSETEDGYGKPVTIDGNAGREDYDKLQKHASLWVMVANRYFVQIELQNQDPTELQEWIKRVDLKKLAEIK